MSTPPFTLRPMSPENAEAMQYWQNKLYNRKRTARQIEQEVERMVEERKALRLANEAAVQAIGEEQEKKIEVNEECQMKIGVAG